ncbi:MAG TPA: Uma2 family endonuclease [Chthoniobacteraceae bacterium]|jgi:Uma2 family endonuclease|nr:Uma2 family endonuclease [Chthoniobacteraceae bacterium]
MTAETLLENPAVRARVARFTVEQYHQLGEYSATGRRTELIRGYVFEKMPKSPTHRSVATRLYNMVFPQLSEGWWMHKEEPLTFADSEPEPDISIMRGQESEFDHAHPRTAALVAEVAVTTLAEDRALVGMYAEAGVEECWIVIPLERKVEVYRRLIAGVYTETLTVSGDATLTCASIPAVEVPLQRLFR